MKRIPKKWKGADGQLHHFVNCITESLNGEQIVISRRWKSKWQAWTYHAQKLTELEMLIRLNKKFRQCGVKES